MARLDWGRQTGYVPSRIDYRQRTSFKMSERCRLWNLKIVRGNQTMRRGTLPFLLLLIVLGISAASVVLWFDTEKDEKSFRNVLNAFRMEESLNLSGGIRVLQVSRELHPSDTGIWATCMQSRQHIKSRLTVNVSHQCSQQQIIHALLKPGRLEIWNTGSTSVPENTSFNPRQYPLTIPHGNPLFTGADLDPKGLSLGQDQQIGYYFINFSMKGAAASKLGSFTSHNIGNYITITFERVVVSSPMLQYTLHGKGQFQMSPRSFKLLGIKCVKV